MKNLDSIVPHGGEYRVCAGMEMKNEKMTKDITFELSVPLNGPLGLAVNSAIDSVNKICEAYQGKATLRIVVKITS